MDTVISNGGLNGLGLKKVLVVGAGGVGCELLKNLGMSGFERVTLIDLDTIDVSNLNRQFLFRKEHVGQAKAKIAAAAIEKMLHGKCKVDPIVGNIKEERFSAKFFGEFDVVLNALDNLDARRHVNRMCLNAKVPMVESGSTGYLGQVTVVHPGKTECYDCNPAPVPKTYAVCTIRSTPEKPVHCVVWAKQLFELLFGPEDESNLLADLAKNDEDAAENGATPMAEGRSLQWDRKQSSEDFAERVLKRVFWNDVLRQREVAEETWKTRAPPEPLDVLKIAKQNADADAPTNLLDQLVWTKEQNAKCIFGVLKRFVERRNDEIGNIQFDKDDDDVLAFVTSAANLRASVYGVELSSAFAVKGIAGNIIHAIATTNAIVAALIVLETIKIVTIDQGTDPKDASLTTYVKRFPNSTRRGKFLVQTERLQAPNRACFVCSKGRLELEIDLSRKLQFLIDKVVRGNLGMINPSIYATTAGNVNIIYESGEGLEPDEVEMYESNAKKSLSDLNVGSGSTLEIGDISQSLNLSVLVTHNPALGSEADPVEFSVTGSIPESASAEAPSSAVEEEALQRSNGNKKRRRKDDGVVFVPTSKKEKLQMLSDMIEIE
ncbi:hypothetical protein NDN08_008151 [Rhodosorus marinus]|uniref:SUMO-activating enzyme subunit n=1 Tax=Rhodosorus marinus TaxID=101924 RepID=A0AAV8UZX5_9RHOD|nr:hypothetical protein NDN08_008151 [Rhodosorus marinus]